MMKKGRIIIAKEKGVDEYPLFFFTRRRELSGRRVRAVSARIGRRGCCKHSVNVYYDGLSSFINYDWERYTYVTFVLYDFDWRVYDEIIKWLNCVEEVIPYLCEGGREGESYVNFLEILKCIWEHIRDLRVEGWDWRRFYEVVVAVLSEYFERVESSLVDMEYSTIFSKAGTCEILFSCTNNYGITAERYFMMLPYVTPGLRKGTCYIELLDHYFEYNYSFKIYLDADGGSHIDVVFGSSRLLNVLVECPLKEYLNVRPSRLKETILEVLRGMIEYCSRKLYGLNSVDEEVLERLGFEEGDVKTMWRDVELIRRRYFDMIEELIDRLVREYEA